jgi:hypothetical protein
MNAQQIQARCDWPEGAQWAYFGPGQPTIAAHREAHPRAYEKIDGWRPGGIGEGRPWLQDVDAAGTATIIAPYGHYAPGVFKVSATGAFERVDSPYGDGVASWER